MALSQNQFAISTVQGSLDLAIETNTLSVQVDVSSAGGLIPGQPVKRVSSVGGMPKVVECAADSDAVFGFINYNIKDSVFVAGQVLEVSAFSGNYMYMTASAAIAADANVAIVIAGTLVKTATTGERIIGKALDAAGAAGDLIRVAILLPGALA